MPPPADAPDAAALIEEFLNQNVNLANEIAFMQEEIQAKDEQLNSMHLIIKNKDASIQKWIRANGSHAPNPKEEQYRKQIIELYDKAQVLSDEKVELAQKCQGLIDKRLLWLDTQIKSLQDRGEFPVDESLPSMLRPKASERVSVQHEPVSASTPGQNGAATTPHVRHPNQHPQRAHPIQTQGLPSTGPNTPSATPASAAAAAILANRQQQQRESSLGASAASAKRQKLTGGLGTLPAQSSGLARHSSMTPGTPRAGTPVRSSSVGPRSQKSIPGNKKVAPQGSRQSGIPRKNKPGKSGLSRVKRTGNKNSPSSTNDSELSDAESGSAEDEDEPGTPPPVKGDVDMADAEEEEGGDDRKYCTCQSVSYGDMVACDNDGCPYEWFHWSCVGLTSEPKGTWICPVCTKNQKK
ncbi:hypothetical protein B0O99DRAFT_605030 [Bisporella sp. PMI_857]|nr:hypothetical protein B0O99DRAFT_605030 [Bisporella sp. PMI_857]